LGGSRGIHGVSQLVGIASHVHVVLHIGADVLQGKRVVVDDTEVTVRNFVGLLDLDPVLDCAEVVAKMDEARRLDS